jgi:hypothetical protein
MSERDPKLKTVIEMALSLLRRKWDATTALITSPHTPIT